MAEKTKENKKEAKESKDAKEQKDASKKKEFIKEDRNEVLVRILGFDIVGSKNVFVGLTKIKGISWALSNAIVRHLNLPKKKKISELSPQEISSIEETIKAMNIVPDYFKNRRSDPETGETAHFYGTDLDMKKEFDIKRMKQMKSYKGIRHSLKQPVRGQRTKSHFRTKGKAMGIKKK